MKQDLNNELKRAYEVLKHLKKKVGSNAFNEEYRMIMNDIKEVLQEPKKSQYNKKREELGKEQPVSKDRKLDEV